MPCYHPIVGYRSKDLNPTGKRSIVFNPTQALQRDDCVKLPCGQCVGCRLERSRRWAVRCMHENQMHEQSSFLTLTYAPDFLPPDGTLVLEHFQKFMKRLRREVSPIRIRFFHCGEYGEKLARPHYHCILFGYDFPDKVHVEDTHDGFQLMESGLLNSIWGMGLCRIGAVTFESAAYVARYITKKITGPEAWWYYDEIDPETGEVLRELRPEYVTMSRRPGIGSLWFEKFKSDLYPDDFVLYRRDGRLVKCKVPKYYDSLLELYDAEMFELVVDERKRAAQTHGSNNTPERLAVREHIHLEKFEQLKRSYENG